MTDKEESSFLQVGIKAIAGDPDAVRYAREKPAPTAADFGGYAPSWRRSAGYETGLKAAVDRRARPRGLDVNGEKWW